MATETAPFWQFLVQEINLFLGPGIYEMVQFLGPEKVFFPVFSGSFFKNICLYLPFGLNTHLSVKICSFGF